MLVTNIWASLGSRPRPRPRPHSSLPLPPFWRRKPEETSRGWASSSPFIPFLLAVPPPPAASLGTTNLLPHPLPLGMPQAALCPSSWMCDSRAYKKVPVSMSVDVGVQ